jgi:tetratricopeptide (TPR) repeat protein
MGKNLALAAFSLALFLGLFEGALTLLGVEPTLAKRDPFVGFADQIPLFQPTEDAPDRMETAPGRLGHFNLQRFDRVKPAGTQRIFCLGGSTTYGRPYDDRTSFCGWLRDLLPRVDPTRRWEVINAGGISYASYRITNLLGELVGYQPDLFIVYTGHNEFLERRTYPDLLDAEPWLIDLRVRLNRTRTYSWLSEAITSAREQDGRDSQEEILPEEVEAILDQSAGLNHYNRANLQRDAALHHFRFNLERIVAEAGAVGAQVVLVRPASNLRASSPFKSEHAAQLDAGERRRARALRTRAIAALEQDEPQAALALLDEAIALDDTHAESHFLRGRALDALGRETEALRAFTRARDEDVVPLRALSTFAAVVAEVATELGTPLVDYEAIAARDAADGIPGADLFLDHVHPTVAAHGRLAAALVEALIDAGLVRVGETPLDEAYQQARAAVEAKVDRRSNGLAQKNLAKVLAWAGKHEESHRAALRGIELVGSWHWEVHAVASRAAVQLRRLDEAIEHARAAVRLAPKNAVERFRLAELLVGRGADEEAAAELRQTLALRPRWAAAHAALGRLRIGSGPDDEALRHLRIAVRLQPSAEHRVALAGALVQAGQDEQARAQLEQASRLDPDNASAALGLAVLYADEGRRGEAETWAQRGLGLARKAADPALVRQAEATLAAVRSAPVR